MRSRPWATACVVVMTLVLLAPMPGCQESAPSAPAEPPAATARVGAAHDWCAEHALPESMCTKCNPSLVPSFRVQRDWCATHGFPESACPMCNPWQAPSAEALEAAARSAAAAPARQAVDWCSGHGLPESQCTKCNPELTEGFKEKGDWCAAHGFPESACPMCNPVPMPEEALASAIPPGTEVRLATPEVARDAGITTTPALGGGVARTLEVVGTLDFDQNQVAELRAPVQGIVRTVEKDLGQSVRAGEVLFVLENTEIGGLQARLQAAAQRQQVASANLTRLEALHAEGITAQRNVELARQERAAAVAEVRSLQNTLRASGAAGATGGRLMVRSPIDGVVVRRPALVGMAADGHTPLATVADLGRMWALLDIPEADIDDVTPGQQVSIKAGERRLPGTIDWISPEVDPHTRTVRVRAVVPNPEGRLRANQFVRARLALESAQGAVMVPRQALQRHGEAQVIFIQTAPGRYEPRAVAPGRRHGELVEVRGAVAPGDAVVTTGAFLLKTELSRENIGAGCCEVDSGARE